MDKSAKQLTDKQWLLRFALCYVAVELLFSAGLIGMKYWIGG